VNVALKAARPSDEARLIAFHVDNPSELYGRLPLLNPLSQGRTVYQVDVRKDDIDSRGLQYRLGPGCVRRFEHLKTLFPELGCLGGPSTGVTFNKQHDG